MKKGKWIRRIEGRRRILSVILAITLMISALGMVGMAEEVGQEETQTAQQEKAESDESGLQQGEESSNDSSTTDATSGETDDPGQDTGAPTDESDTENVDGEQTEQNSGVASQADTGTQQADDNIPANTPIKRELSNAAYLRTDLAIDTNDSGANNQSSGGRTVVYTATVNKATDSLNNYTLTPTFTGDGTTVTKVEVYIIESGEEKLLSEGSDYTLNGNEVILTNLSNAFQVKYYV